MRLLLSIILALFLPVQALAHTAGPGVCNGADCGHDNHGLLGQYATDETLEVLYTLDHFKALPPLPRYYFSAGPMEEGDASAGGNFTLTDAGQTWDTNQFAGLKIRVISGTALGQTRTIGGNTGTVVTVTEQWTTNPANLDDYEIYSGLLPPGNDSNVGSMTFPLRSFQKANELIADASQIHRVWDTDRWVTTGAGSDWGTATAMDLTDRSACADEEGVCLIDSGIDFTGNRKPIIDCENVALLTAGFFVDQRESFTGEWMIQNFEFQGCPSTDTTGQDLIQTLADKAQITALNVVGHEIQGSNNQLAEGHGGRLVTIGLEGSFGDSTSNGGVIDHITGDFIFIGNKPMVNTDAPSAYSWVVRHDPSDDTFNSDESNLWVIGPTLYSTTSDTSNGRGIMYDPGTIGGVDITETRTTLIDVLITGFSNASAAVGISAESGSNALLSRFNLFRVTVTDSYWGIRIFGLTGSNPADGISQRWFGRCLMLDELGGTSQTVRIDNNGDAEAEIDIDFEGIVDDDENVTTYYIGAQTGQTTTVAVQNLATPNDGDGFTNFFETNSFDSGGGADGDQFGAPGPIIGLCDDDEDCYKACDYPWVETFINGMYINKAVLGTKIIGLQLNTDRTNDANIGAR